MLKSFLAVIFVAFTASAAQAQHQPVFAPVVAASSDYYPELTVRADPTRKISWYQHNTSPAGRSANDFFAYFGVTEDGEVTPLRVVASYHAKDWLFVMHAYARIDGERAFFPYETYGPYGWNKDNFTDVWEWSDAQVQSPQDLLSLQKIAASKEASIEFFGEEKASVLKLNEAQKHALTKVLEAHRDAVANKKVLTSKVGD